MARINKLYEKPRVTTVISNDDLLSIGQKQADASYDCKTITITDFLADISILEVLSITRANLIIRINASALDISKFYLVTDAPIPFIVQASNINKLSEIAIAKTTGVAYRYDIATNAYSIYKRGTAFVDIADGATVTVDFSLSENFSVSLGGNRTLAFSNLSDGDSGLLLVYQDEAGGRTLTLPEGSRVLNNGEGVLDLSTEAGAIDAVAFIKKDDGIIFSLNKNAN
jgi:hypothetical protein